VATERDPVIGTTIVVLSAPRGIRTAAALALLRRAAPTLNAEFDHVFEPAGGALAASSIALAANSTLVAGGGRPLIGMIDGGVAQSPALASAMIEQKGFAGPPQATGHGTAIASLIVGSNGKFRGAAPGAALLVGDVYGGNPSAGSALAIVKALSWIASHRPSAVNISLVGPRNRVVERAIAAVQAKGIKVVAAVGNDGPAAPPLYPASQPGVIAVTGVDATNRALAEAGRSSHLDYAAPGADMAAALPGKGYAKVRGTSFAAPFITSRLALRGSTALLDAEASKKGRGRIGRGIVCGECRVAPKQVGAK
jgi:subtilisin family serine protease